MCDEINLVAIKPLIKVLLAEDHELTRIGLIHSLSKSRLVDLVGEAEDGKEALDLVTQTRPNVVLMDIGMPILDGIMATKLIKQNYPETKIVILTSHKEQHEVLASMTAGADAYCSKEIKVERLIQVIEMVMEGVLWIDPAIAQTVLNLLTQGPNNPNTTDKIIIHPDLNSINLTDRELEVLSHIVSGKPNKEIAEAMNLSVYTVKGHVCSIIQKLAVSDRTQAALKALKIGLIQQ